MTNHTEQIEEAQTQIMGEGTTIAIALAHAKNELTALQHMFVADDVMRAFDAIDADHAELQFIMMDQERAANDLTHFLEWNGLRFLELEILLRWIRHAETSANREGPGRPAPGYDATDWLIHFHNELLKIARSVMGQHSQADPGRRFTAQARIEAAHRLLFDKNGQLGLLCHLKRVIYAVAMAQQGYAFGGSPSDLGRIIK